MNNLNTIFIVTVVVFMFISSGIEDRIKNDLKSQSVKESLNYQELKDRTEKLAQYCKTLEYEISVLATKGQK